MSDKIQKKPRKESLVPVDEVRHCLNCGHLDTGKYCSNCGQSFSDINRPFKEIFHEFFGMISFDTSFFRTIPPFLFKPGFLSREYLNGKRKKYMSPVRLYLFLSIVFFFILRTATSHMSGNNQNVIFNAGGDSTQVDTALVSQYLDSVYNGGIDGSGLDAATKEAIKDSAIRALTEEIPGYRKGIALDATNESDSSKMGRHMEESVKNAVEEPAIYLNTVLKYISYGLFLLMPLFALLLQLIYIRRKKYYIEHLIFSINMHSFALLIFSILGGLSLLIKGEDDFLFVLLLIVPVYFVIGMKRFYGQGIMKVIAKSLILGLVYTSVLVVVLIGIAILALL